MLGSLSSLDAEMYRWGHLLLSLTYGVIVLCAVVFSGWGTLRLLRVGALAPVSRISYTLYLVHPLFLSAAFQVAGRREVFNDPIDIGLMLVALVASIAFATASFRLLEKSAIGYSHLFRYRSVHPAGSAPAG